ncbi:hypothetical protein H0Z60_16210 [Ectothiorhodospiraceae bacterium WFHF3C12]|nr:hypothetical protein [Ectothiorhodospiraceae bacterium WFHF3C12]
MGQIDVSVSGLVAPLQQPNAMACWATTYTMLYSWKRQASFTIPAALSELGEEYLQRFRQGQGLPGNQHRALANAAGLVAEPLYNPSLGGWVEMLRKHGPLLAVYGWEVFNQQGGRQAGRHAIVVYRIAGDGTPGGTHFYFINPSDSKRYKQAFSAYRSRHETGFTVDQNITDTDLATFSQILHYD